MRSYIKLYGPPIWKAIEALNKIADEMPEITYYHFLWPMPTTMTAPGERVLVAEGAESPEVKQRISRGGYTLRGVRLLLRVGKDTHI